VEEPLLETERLLLRRWREADKEPFAGMNADPRVMEYMPGLLSREQSDALVDRIEHHFRHGFGLWAAELRDSAEFIGFIGLSKPDFDASFTPCVEVGWRLAPQYWSRGLATEGAREAVRFAFQVLRLDSLVSFTVRCQVLYRLQRSAWEQSAARRTKVLKRASPINNLE
jgi:RimJ/RimL family protein N-acetyltransferase